MARLDTNWLNWKTSSEVGKTYRSGVHIFDADTKESIQGAYVTFETDPPGAIEFNPSSGYTNEYGEFWFDWTPQQEGEISVYAVSSKTGYEGDREFAYTYASKPAPPKVKPWLPAVIAIGVGIAPIIAEELAKGLRR